MILFQVTDLFSVTDGIARGSGRSVGTVDLYRTSGHWEHYKENMFPAMEVEGESFVLRPMNCPHHMMIYANRLHSYRDLPIRIGEVAHDFRFEPSGTLKGIERGRHFCQNDAHLFVTPDQIKDEVASVVNLIREVYQDFHITDYGLPGLPYHGLPLRAEPAGSGGQGQVSPGRRDVE